MESEGVLRLETNGLVVVPNCPLQVPLKGMGNAAVIEGRGHLRVKADSLVEVLDGAVGLGLLAIGCPAVIEGYGVLRIELYRLVVVLDGTICPTLHPVGRGPVIVSDGKPRPRLPACLNHRRTALDHQVRARAVGGADTPFLRGRCIGGQGREGNPGDGREEAKVEKAKSAYHGPLSLSGESNPELDRSTRTAWAILDGHTPRALR